MRATGIDLPLTPVLDVASQPANPVIGVRSYGPDARAVARHGAATIRGLQRAGVATCAKHFPGHGDTDIDSHLELPTLDIDEALLHRRDVHPFAEAIDAGVDSVMTGHLVVPALGDLPASAEPAAAALLRRLGHTGPIVTDALDMAALHAGDADAGPGTTAAGLIATAAVRALAGGADLLCLGSTDGRDDAALFHEVVDTVLQAVTSGVLDAGALATSAARNRALIASVHRRQQRVPAPDLLTALTELEDIGAQVATAAVRTEGDVHLQPGDGLVDLRQGVNIAAGAHGGGIVDLLNTRAGLRVLEPSQVPEWLAAHPTGRLAVLTHHLTDEVAPVLAQAPRAVVVHLGVPGAAPAAPHRILGHGAALANCLEIVTRCTQVRSPG